MSASDGRLGFPEQTERSELLNGSVFTAIGAGTPYLLPLTVVNGRLYDSGIQLPVPRVVVLQEEEGVIPVHSLSTPASQQTGHMFAEPDVALAAATSPLHVEKWNQDLVRGRCMPTTAVPPASNNSEKQPVNDAILKAMESVKVQDQNWTEADGNVEPLDLTRSASSLAAESARELQLAKLSKYHHIPTLQHGRSSSYGSLSALKAFYDDPAIKSWSKKTRTGSLNSPIADTDVKPGEETHSEKRGRADNALSAKIQAEQSYWNADVVAAWRSKFRPRPYQKSCSKSSSLSSLFSQTAFDPPESTLKESTTNSQDNSWKLESGTTGVSTSHTDLQSPQINDNNSADLDIQFSRSTSDATDMGSKAEAVSPPAEMEKRFHEGPPVAEAYRSSAMDTLDFRESTPIVKTSVKNESFKARVEENGDAMDQSPIVKCTLDSRPVSRDDIYTPPPRSGSSLTGSSFSTNNSDLSWRLPPKKRRMLDPSVLSAVDQFNTQVLEQSNTHIQRQSNTKVQDSATVDDRVALSDDEKTAACIETRQPDPPESEYIKLSMSIIILTN